MAILGYMLEELLIFLGRPEAFPQLLLVAAGVPPHFQAEKCGPSRGEGGENVEERDDDRSKQQWRRRNGVKRKGPILKGSGRGRSQVGGIELRFSSHLSF